MSLRDRLCVPLSKDSQGNLKNFLTEQFIKETFNIELVAKEIADSYKRDAEPNKLLRMVKRSLPNRPTDSSQSTADAQRTAHAQTLANTVCGFDPSSSAEEPPMSGDKTRSYWKIMAILILIKRSFRIGSIIKEGISDEDLPLKKHKKYKHIAPDSLVPIRLRPKGSNDDGPECFTKWKWEDKHDFYERQWYIAPEFEYQEGVIPHYDFEENTILPFTSRRKLPLGGYGLVYEVEIPSHCHGFPTSTRVSALVILSSLMTKV